MIRSQRNRVIACNNEARTAEGAKVGNNHGEIASAPEAGGAGVYKERKSQMKGQMIGAGRTLDWVNITGQAQGETRNPGRSTRTHAHTYSSMEPGISRRGK